MVYVSTKLFPIVKLCFRVSLLVTYRLISRISTLVQRSCLYKEARDFISNDYFVFRVCTELKPFTRRGALSVINSIFDPIGFTSPITMCGKLLLREMMSSSESGHVNWDEDLPEKLRLRWDESSSGIENSPQIL